ncbi:MAG: hypothetical protein WCS94_14055 [Verrucomicrobiota bacterium]
MNNTVKYLALISAGLGALNAQAGFFQLGTGSAQNVPTYVAAGSASPQSGKSTFTVTFSGGTGTWTSGKLGGGNAADPSNGQYDSWFSAVGALSGANQGRPSNVSGYNGSYFQILSDNDLFSSITIDPSSTLLLAAGSLNSPGYSPSGTYDTAGGKSYNGNTSYTLVVDWTLAANQDIANDPAQIYFKFAATEPVGGKVDTVSAISQINIVSVPEPGQALAGVMLLGCGALVFTGRRWISKQAAK